MLGSATAHKDGRQEDMPGRHAAARPKIHKLPRGRPDKSLHWQRLAPSHRGMEATAQPRKFLAPPVRRAAFRDMLGQRLAQPAHGEVLNVLRGAVLATLPTKNPGTCCVKHVRRIYRYIPPGRKVLTAATSMELSVVAAPGAGDLGRIASGSCAA